MKDDSVLVIGGSRFVGPFLLNLLKQVGADITVFNRGNEQDSYDGVQFVQGDRHEDFDKLAAQHFDVVIDMCAYTGDDTQQLIDEVSFDFLVHFGTVASYELPDIYPITEDHQQGEWFWGAYGAGKLECERVLMQADIEFATLRPTYILGANNYVDREAFLYRKLMAGETITLPGNGLGMIQFVFADEVARSLYELAAQRAEGAYNCVGNEYVTLEGLVQLMAEIVEVEPSIEYDLELGRGEFDEQQFPFANEHSIYMNDKIKALGVDFMSLEQGLRRDWEAYYQNQVE